MNFLLALLGIAYSKECQNYVCKSLIAKECLMSEGSVIYVDDCDSGYYCDQQESSVYSYCIKQSDSLPYAWPGESCSSAQCAYGYCNGDKCVGQEYNETCSVSDECNPGMYCHKGLCEELLSIGDSGCKSDYDCEYTAGCMGGECVEYYSIHESHTVECVNNRSEFCVSGSCFENYCLGHLTNDNGEGVECDTSEDCVNTKYYMDIYPVKFYTECKCSLNGKSYCDLFPSDELMLTYRESWFDWVDSGHISSCNTVRRFAPYCIEDKWHKNRYNKLMYYTYLVSNYTQVKGAENCVLETLNSDYFESKKTYNSLASHLSSALILVLLGI